MRYIATLIVVTDMERSKHFYQSVLGRRVEEDLGANVTLTGGIVLQTIDTWKAFIQKEEQEIGFGGNAGELYFEEEDFDAFLERLHRMPDIIYVHPPIAHSWGQRVVRFYDPDRHIIEVGEKMKRVVRRFLESGLSIAETARRMDVPVGYVQSCLEGEG